MIEPTVMPTKPNHKANENIELRPLLAQAAVNIVAFVIAIMIASRLMKIN